MKKSLSNVNVYLFTRRYEPIKPQEKHDCLLTTKSKKEII